MLAYAEIPNHDTLFLENVNSLKANAQSSLSRLRAARPQRSVPPMLCLPSPYRQHEEVTVRVQRVRVGEFGSAAEIALPASIRQAIGSGVAFIGAGEGVLALVPARGVRLGLLPDDLDQVAHRKVGVNDVEAE